MTVVRYRKRPVSVDTIQWTGDNEAEVREFTGAANFHVVPVHERAGAPGVTASVYDRLHATWIGMYTGQHIVRGVRGELHPIAEDVLAETYERVDGGAGDFFEPGHTYLHERLRWKFRCDAVTVHPDTGNRVAVGWSFFGHGKWQTGDMSDEIWAEGGWIDVTGAGGVR